MNLLSHLQDQFRHMEWADAMVWRTTLSLDTTVADETLRTRLHHIHQVQRVFLSVWQGAFAHLQDSNERRQAVMAWVSKGNELRGSDLLAWGQEYHRDVQSYLNSVSEEALAQDVTLPWSEMVAARIGQTPAASTLAETLQQVTMHSAYHRGQVNTRLRELGAEPPLVDFIAWVWLGKPAATWIA
ncbi:MAG TPA: DinB family protein [Blastocatellia bacterium]|nr:DinB family protein [Blastocatellia bacterium]